jgi:hypothetical protein
MEKTGCVKRLGFPEDNIIVAPDSQSRMIERAGQLIHECEPDLRR